MDIPSYHLNFVNEEYDENGILKKFSIKYPDNFNFAYDIIDKYGEMEPDRRALMWVDLQGNEKLLTYGDLSKLSNRAANMFRGWGIKKGDKVMLVLKRNYQYWYAIIGLMKIGAIAIPATHISLSTQQNKEEFPVRNSFPYSILHSVLQNKPSSLQPSCLSVNDWKHASFHEDLR